MYEKDMALDNPKELIWKSKVSMVQLNSWYAIRELLVKGSFLLH